MNRAKSTGSLALLSCLLLESDADSRPLIGELISDGCSREVVEMIDSYQLRDFGELWGLANSHHVVMRALPRLHEVVVSQGTDKDKTEWVDHALEQERSRIENALTFLSSISEALAQVGDLVVIKSLDHWPDIGNDLDLYSNAKSSDIIAVMCDRFRARPDHRSWGDRLAGKWNFVVPGLPELVEVHVGRLGQTGEQVAITNSLVNRSSKVEFGGHSLRVPAPEDRITISTLQRMYRHFYIRLCDIVDNARLMDRGEVDYVYLKSLATKAGLWDGLATYMQIISDYVKSYRGEGLALPELVTSAARFGNERVSFKRRFLRIPIFPQAAGFYFAEWERLLRNGELQNTLRLSLLPGLAAAAALEFKLTGSDKGIW
jgi:hypothetical protein